MKCCDRILLLFLFFSICQYITQWRMDFTIVNSPWKIGVRGQSEKMHFKSSSYITFSEQAIFYGNPIVNVTESTLHASDRQEIDIVIYVNVSGPPMSFHRLALTVNDIPEREISLITSLNGVSEATIYSSMIHKPTNSLKIKYMFDDIWSTDGFAQATVEAILSSGSVSLWDVKWYGVYKE